MLNKHDIPDVLKTMDEVLKNRNEQLGISSEGAIITKNGKSNVYLKVIKNRIQFRQDSVKGTLLASYFSPTLDSIPKTIKHFTTSFWHWDWD